MKNASAVIGALGLAAILAAGGYLVGAGNRADDPTRATAPAPPASPTPATGSVAASAPRRTSAPQVSATPNETKGATRSAPAQGGAATVTDVPPPPAPAVTAAPAPTAVPPVITPASTPVPAATPAADPQPTAAPQTPTTSKAKSDDSTVTVKKDAVIGIRLDRTITSDTARVDDKVTARVARDVVVDGRTAIPAGARLEGIVSIVERASPARDRGRLGIRFTTLILGNNRRIAVQTDTILRGSDLPGDPSAALGASAAFGATSQMRGRLGQVDPASGRLSPAPSTARDARILAGALLTVKLTAPLSIQIGLDQVVNLAISRHRPSSFSN